MKAMLKARRALVAFCMAGMLSAPLYAATDVANIAAGTCALPAGYTQLEYAQTDGSVYSNIGVKEDFKGRVEIKFSVPSDDEQYLWGIRDTKNTTSKALSLGVSSGKKITLEFGSKSYNLGAPVANEPYYASLDYGGLSYSLLKTSSGEAQSSGSFTATTDTESTRQIQFFAVNNGGGNANRAKSGARVYYFKYYGADGTLKLDFIPVKDANGTVGFYDSVRGGLISFDAGSCTAGPSIMAVGENTTLTAAKTADKLLIASGATLDQNGQTLSVTDITTVPADVPAGFTRLASLHVNSNVIFKTQYKPGASDKAEIKVKFTERSTVSGSKVLFGARSAQSGSKDAMACWHWWSGKDADKIRWDYGKSGGSDAVVHLLDIGTKYIFSLKSGEGLVKSCDAETDAETVVYTDTYPNGTVAANASYMWLLGFTGADTKSNSNSSQYYACSTDFYWFKATDANDGTVVKCHFVPARRESDGTVGVFDLTGNYGFVEPTIASGGIVTEGDAVMPGAATIALSDDVSVSGAVTAYAPLTLAKSTAASGDVTVAVPGAISGVGGITVGSGVTLNVGVKRLDDVSVAFEQGAGLALQLTSATDSPVVKVASEPSSVKVYGVDGTTLIEDAVTVYDATEGTVSVTLPTTPVWRNTKGNGSFDDVDNWSQGALPGAGVTFEVVLSADTEITVSGTHSLGSMIVKGGHVATFAGSGSLTVGSVTVESATTVKTGGVVSFGGFEGDGSIVYSPGAADALVVNSASSLGGELKIVTDKNLSVTLNAAAQVGTLTVSGEVNAVVTMSNGMGGSFVATDGATVEGGVLQQGSVGVLGATPTVTVKNGGTFDFNKLNPDAATSYVIAGAGAGNWPWAMTSTGGTVDDYFDNITLTSDATIGSSENSQIKIGSSSDPGAANRGRLTLNGHTLTVAGGMWTTYRYISMPGAGTIDFAGRGIGVYQGAFNNQGGETTLVLRPEASKTVAIYNATTVYALDWRGYKINTEAALTISSSLTVSGGEKETARLTFADGATAVLSNNLSITTTLTANGALSLTRAAGLEDAIAVAATNAVNGSGTITVGAGVTLDLGKCRPASASINMSEGAALMLQLKSDTEIPVLKVTSEIDTAKMTVFDKDGNEVPDFRATYDGEAGTMTIYAGVYVWTNADSTGSFENAANWSVGSTPPSGKDFIVEVTGDTTIAVNSDYTLGNMEVRGGGTATFAGSGSISVTKASVAAGTALVTGGKVTFPAIDLPAGATAMLPDPSMLANGNLVGGGTLVLAPGEGITVTMSGGNTKWTGQTVIENGTVKYKSGRSFGNEDTTANVVVKGGATLDQNGVRWLDRYAEKPAVRLEEGAVLTSSGDIDDNKGGVITKLSLSGDATVHADEHMVYMSKWFNEAYVTIELGTNTLAKTGTNEFFISVCNITGTGTLDIREGMVSVTHPYSGSSYGKCSNGTINIHEGAQFRFRDYDGKTANFSVSNLVLNGRVERDGVDLAGAQLDHMLTVTGTLSGSGAARMLTLASGAALKPDGTSAPTVEEELVLPEDKLTVDLGGIDLGPRRQDIPLILVGDAALLPTAENIEFKNVTVYGERKDKLPVHWELKSTRTGTGYRLIRGGTTIYLR